MCGPLDTCSIEHLSSRRVSWLVSVSGRLDLELAFRLARNCDSSLVNKHSLLPGLPSIGGPNLVLFGYFSKTLPALEDG